MHDSQEFDRLRLVGDGYADQSLLNRAELVHIVTG
jgi:hypothetical protein